MISKNALIFLIILLIISITPISAYELSQTKQDESKNINDNLDDIVQDSDDLEDLTKEINIHCTNINESANYVRDNWYKFWKWVKVYHEINKVEAEANLIETISEELKAKGSEINSDAQNLNESLNNNSNNDINQDINEIVENLKNKHNITLEIEKPNNFQKGDIVAYLGPLNSYKYLEFVEEDNITHYIILKNRDNQQIALSNETFNKMAVHKLKPKNLSTNILNTIYETQVEELNNQKTQAEKKIKTSKRLATTGTILMGIAAGILALLGIIILLQILVVAINCFTFDTTLVINMVLVKTFIVLTICGVTITLASGVLLILSGQISKSGENQLKSVNNTLTDLDIYPNSFPIAGDLNLTTNATVSVNGTLNGTDFDGNKLTYVIVKQPEHGILNISQNGSFTYTPNNNFTGQESFKYKVNDKIVDSNIATVDITVLSNTTQLIINNINGKVGDRVNLTAKLVNNMGKGIANETVIFKINNTVVGKVKTNDNGTAILKNYLLRIKGKYLLEAIFNGDNLYKCSIGTSFIKIDLKKLTKFQPRNIIISSS